MTWKQLLEYFLQYPDKADAFQEYQRQLAVLSIAFPTNLDQELLPTLGMHYIAQAELIKKLPETYLASADDFGISLQYLRPQVALDAALMVNAILSALELQSTIALGFGQGIELQGEWKSIERIRTKRLTRYCNSQEIAATDTFLNTIEIPDGVGSFAAPLKLQKSVGFAFWILKDYR